MESDSYLTYKDDSTYTLFFTLSNYIPMSGVLTVTLPEEIVINGDPYAALTQSEFTSIDGGYGMTSDYDFSISKNVDLYYINYRVPV